MTDARQDGHRGGRGIGGGRPGPRREFRRQEDDPPGTSRLFIAVPVPDDVREAIGKVMEAVAGGAVDERAPGRPRWVRVDGLHVTLRFLGATPDERIDDVSRALERAAQGFGSFDIELRGGGAFPDPARPRVLWVGIESGSRELGELAGRIGDELHPLGWTPEQRPLSAHLTLARTDGVPDADHAARRLMDEARDLDLRWTCDRLILYKSLVGRGPAHYQAISEANLGTK
jgi:RNA 2',3'-cyclic 3'-phosphodiesterase